MSAPLPSNALKSLREAYARKRPPRVFSLVAGKHWGQSAPKLSPEQLTKALEVVHEQYQRGYRGLRLRRNVAMRMGGFCNINSMVFLSLTTTAAQLISLYTRWRMKQGVTESSGAFATRERLPATKTFRSPQKKKAKPAG